MLVERDPRTDDAAIQTMIVAHAKQAEEAADDAVRFRELGTVVAAADWLCEQLAVFEYGGLLDFLDVKAGSSLVERCDQVRDWAETRMNGYVLEDANGSALRVRDLSTGAPLEVLNIGALTDRGPDCPVIGRVVPVATGPGLMFESRPVSVDLATAQGVAAASTHEDSAYWITCIGDGRHDDRLEYAFSCRNGTLFSSDIVPMSSLQDEQSVGPPPGRLVELLDQGLSEKQANGVMVAEVAFIVITVSGDRGGQHGRPACGGDDPRPTRLRGPARALHVRRARCPLVGARRLLCGARSIEMRGAGPSGCRLRRGRLACGVSPTAVGGLLYHRTYVRSREWCDADRGRCPRRRCCAVPDRRGVGRRRPHRPDPGARGAEVLGRGGAGGADRGVRPLAARGRGPRGGARGTAGPGGRRPGRVGSTGVTSPRSTTPRAGCRAR